MRCAIVTSCLGLVVAEATIGAPPPVHVFTDPPRYEDLQISPDGRYLALTQRVQDAELLTVLQFPELKPVSQRSFGKDTDIGQYYWAKNNRLLIQPERTFPGQISFKAPTGEVIGVDPDGKNFAVIFSQTPGPGASERKPFQSRAEILDLLPENANEVLIQTKGFAADGDNLGEFNAVYRMHVRTGRLILVQRSPTYNGSFLVSPSRKVPLVLGQGWRGDLKIYRQNAGDGTWQMAREFAARRGNLLPIGFGTDDRLLVVDSTDGRTDAIAAWDPDMDSAQELFRASEASVQAFDHDPSGRIWLFRIHGRYPVYWYPDPQHPLARLHQSLRTALKDTNVEVRNTTLDMSRAVVKVDSPTLSTRFLVMDVKEQKVLQQLVAYPDLKATDLSPTTPIAFKARDGLEIHGYLTQQAAGGAGPRPMVVLVHGGPHGITDSYGFDPEVQLLASRGYAVLQVNFRGSGGRGLEFIRRGYGRWGLEMQDDITDGVRWAIEQRMADAKRICIFGTSYGAYAALTGAFREPEMFRCAIGISGVYDLPLLFDDGDIREVERGVLYLREAVGTDMAELRRRSPVYNADRIKAAVMLIHGGEDDRAPYAHATRMRDALRKAGNEPEWLAEHGEAHGFSDAGHRAEAYERVLGFLDRNLGP